MTKCTSCPRNRSVSLSTTTDSNHSCIYLSSDPIPHWNWGCDAPTSCGGLDATGYYDLSSYDWPPPSWPLWLTLYGSGSHNRGGHGWGGYDPIPCKTTIYRLSEIKFLLHFAIALLNSKSPHVPFLIANYQARPWYVHRPSQDYISDRYWPSFVFHLTHISLSFTPTFVLFDL